MNLILVLFLCLGASYLAGAAFKRFKLPVVLGPIMIGLILGLPVVRGPLFQGDLSLMASFSDLGLLFLMFYVGLQLETEKLGGHLKGDLVTAGFALLIPFLVGASLGALFGLGGLGSLLLGFIFAIISETVPVEILEEIGLLRTPAGEKILFLGTISDFLVTLEIVLVVALLEGVADWGDVLLRITLELLIFASIAYVAVFVVAPAFLKGVSRDSPKDLFLVSLILVLALSAVADLLGLGSILGALVAGIVVRAALRQTRGPEVEEELAGFIDLVTFGFFAPFFFIWIGLNTDLAAVAAQPFFGLALLAGLFAAKIAGVLVARLVTKEALRTALGTGFGISILGGVDLIFAELARSHGIIATNVFSALVFMSVLSVVIAPVFFLRFTRPVSI